MTTTIIHKIGASNSPVGMDYTSLQAWLDACPANLVTADQVWVGEVYNQGEISLGSTRVVKTIITDATRNIILRPASGASFRDNAAAATNPLRYNASAGAAITGAVNYDGMVGVTADFETWGLQWRNSAGANQGVLLIGGGGSGKVYVHESIISQGSTYRGNTQALKIGASGTSVVENCLIIYESTADSSIALLTFDYGGTATNCTIVCTAGSTGYGVSASYGPIALNNCAFFGSSNLFATNNRNIAGSNNATDQATFTGSVGSGTNALTGSVLNVAFSTATFAGVSGVTFGAGSGLDFRLSTGSALIGAASDATATHADIIGTARPFTSPSDIGAWQVFVAAFIFAPHLTWID